MHFKNILFPVDFSERSRAVVPHVRDFCARFNSSLTLLHVVEMPASSYGSAEAPVMFNFPLSEMKACAEADLTKFAATEFPGMLVRTAVEQGDPGSGVAAFARRSQSDLIMLPTRGCGRFRAALLGSVTAKTLHDATCAVWTEGHCEELTAAPVEWRKVICAVDTISEAPRLIRFAAELVAESGAEVCLVHTVRLDEAAADQYSGRQFSTFLRDQARQNIAEMQKAAGTSFEVCIETGNIPDAIRRVTADRHADLVVIGRGSAHRFAGQLLSHSYAIVRDMPCPVISIADEG